ncbi:MAG: prepilin peptidase [bacterium]
MIFSQIAANHCVFAFPVYGTASRFYLFSPYFFFFISIFIFFIGLSVGSFLNVVIFRVPKKSSIVRPSSSCPHCGSKIKLYDNIPVLSYIILSGRCRKCGNKISPVYPVVELLAAIILYLLFLKYFYSAYFFYKIDILNILYFKKYLWMQLSYFIAYGIFIIIIIPVAFIDLFHRIIPDILNVLLIVSGFVLNIFLLHKPILFPLTGFLIPGLFFYFIALFYETVKKKEGLGGGDIKLIAGIGAYLGLTGAAFTIFAGSIFALAGFILFFILQKLRKADALSADFKIGLAGLKVPFGPFLSLASIFYIFYGDFLIKIYWHIIKYH